jgi:hypothetical protein
METKTWMTAKRIARGPEAANAELERWRRVREKREAHKPHVAPTFSSTETMRRDAVASKAAHVGSRVAAAPVGSVDLIDVALVAVALAGVYGFWRIIRSTRDDVAESTYGRGLDALAAR